MTSEVTVTMVVVIGTLVATTVIEGTAVDVVAMTVVTGVVYPSNEEQYGCRVFEKMAEVAEATGHGIAGFPGSVELTKV